MNHYEEVYGKLKEKYTDEEIAEGFMIPETLTEEEQKISDEEFRKIRFRLLNNRTEKQRLMSEITRLRISIKVYLEQEIYDPSFSFGQKLEEYIGGYRLIFDDNGLVFNKKLDVWRISVNLAIESPILTDI